MNDSEIMAAWDLPGIGPALALNDHYGKDLNGMKKANYSLRKNRAGKSACFQGTSKSLTIIDFTDAQRATRMTAPAQRPRH